MLAARAAAADAEIDEDVDDTDDSARRLGPQSLLDVLCGLAKLELRVTASGRWPRQRAKR